MKEKKSFTLKQLIWISWISLQQQQQKKKPDNSPFKRN